MTAIEKVQGPGFPGVLPSQKPFSPPLAPVQHNLLTAQDGTPCCPALSSLENPEFAQSYNVHTTYILCFSLIQDGKYILMKRAVVEIMSYTSSALQAGSLALTPLLPGSPPGPAKDYLGVGSLWVI